VNLPRRWGAAATSSSLILLVAACAPEQPGIFAGDGASNGVAAPLGVGRGEAVDGMTVGDRLMAAGEYELALSAYTRAISENGLTGDVLAAIGSANMKLGRLGQAREDFYAALDRDDRNIPAWNNLGVTLVGLQEYAEAREAFKVAFSLDAGQSNEIRNNLLLMERYDISSGVEFPSDDEFVLVRGGNGVYFLLSPKEQ
jgi:tetratricopeptide (TPR) repeat protein